MASARIAVSTFGCCSCRLTMKPAGAPSASRSMPFANASRRSGFFSWTYMIGLVTISCP